MVQASVKKTTTKNKTKQKNKNKQTNKQNKTKQTQYAPLYSLKLGHKVSEQAEHLWK